MQTKRCNRCGEDKPLDEFYVHKRLADGKVKYHGKCKKCYNEVHQEWLERDPERHAKKVEYKRQWNDENREKLRQGEKRRWAKLRESKPKKQKLTDEERKQRHKESQRRSSEKRKEAQRKATQERKRERARREETEGRICRLCGECKSLNEYDDNGYGGKRRQCKACINAVEERRMQTDPDFAEHTRHRRRLATIRRKKKSVGSHTLAEWKALKAQYNHTCICCKRQEPEVQLTRDHIVPLSKGGTNNIDNIQPLCQSCNSKKHRKTVDYRE